MPLYEYLCRSCGTINELLIKGEQKVGTECIQCGSGDMVRLISAPSIITEHVTTHNAQCDHDSPCCGSQEPCGEKKCDCD